MHHACDAGSHHLYMHLEHPSVLLAGVQCNMHVMQVTPPSFVCTREHPCVLLLR